MSERSENATDVLVLDTNVFVAAGFRPDSASGRILRAVRSAELRMVWSDATRRETELVVQRIPPLDDESLLDVFRDEDRFAGALEPDRFTAVPDPADRKFAALAHAADAQLLTADDHLLEAAGPTTYRAMTPGAWWRRRHE